MPIFLVFWYVLLWVCFIFCCVQTSLFVFPRVFLSRSGIRRDDWKWKCKLFLIQKSWIFVSTAPLELGLNTNLRHCFWFIYFLHSKKGFIWRKFWSEADRHFTPTLHLSLAVFTPGSCNYEAWPSNTHIFGLNYSCVIWWQMLTQIITWKFSHFNSNTHLASKDCFADSSQGP